MRLIKAFGRFCYEFIVGDDWKIAASILVALAVLAVATVGAWFGDAGLAVFGAALIMLAFAVSLVIDVRPSKP